MLSPTSNNQVINYTIIVDVKTVNDTLNYDLSGNNIPSNYQGQTGTLKSVNNLSGLYDTAIPQNTIKNNVPANYHIVGNPNINYTGGVDKIEIAPNQENVNVTYTDQNHNTYTGAVNGAYEQKISDITTKDTVPQGYHVINGQDKSYTFNGDKNQNDSLDIAGNPQSDNISINIAKYDNRKFVNQENDVKTIHETGIVGNTFTINPSNYQPNGYKQQTGIQTFTFKPNISNQSITLNYDATKGSAITVNYINQRHTIIKTGTITGNVDDNGKIANKVSVPAGYIVDNNQPSNYRITPQSQSPININVTGKNAQDVKGNGNFTITIDKRINHKDNYSNKNIQITGQVGDSNTLIPSNYTPTGYNSISQPVIVSITANGLIANNGTNKGTNKATFVYDVNAQAIMPIKITYINQNNHYINVNNGQLTNSSQDATSTINANQLATLGGVGDTVDITGFINAPQGYHFDGSKDKLVDSKGNTLNEVVLQQATQQHPTMMLTMVLPTPNINPNNNGNKLVNPSHNNNNKPDNVNPISPNHNNSNTNKKGNNTKPIKPNKPNNTPTNPTNHKSNNNNHSNTNKGGNKGPITPNKPNHNTNNNHTKSNHKPSNSNSNKPITPTHPSHTTKPNKPSNNSHENKHNATPTHKPKKTNHKTISTHNKNSWHPTSKQPIVPHKKPNLNKHINHQIHVMHHTINKLKHEYHINDVTKHNKAMNRYNNVKNTHKNNATITHKQEVNKTITSNHPTNIIKGNNRNAINIKANTNSTNKTSSNKVTYANHEKLPQTNEVRNHSAIIGLLIGLMAFVLGMLGIDLDKKRNK